MNTQRIVLYCDDIAVSALSKEGDKYHYEINYENVKNACKNGCPTQLIGSEFGDVDEIPPIFYEFDISPHRKELREKLGIVKGDSRFDMLYKQAQKSELFSKRGFWIGVE